MKNNIFIFWIGDNSKIKNLVDDLKSKDFNVIVGPSSEEHEYLYKKYAYYKRSYDLKIWSFCSDIWRFYILSSNNGLYIDTTVGIGENFINFFNRASEKDYYFVKERKSVIASAIIGSFGDGNIFKEALEIMENFNQYDPKYYFVAPFVLTKLLKEKFSYPDNWDKFANETIFIDTLPSIRNKSEIIKYGAGSWMIGKKNFDDNFDKNDMWSNVEKDWNDRNFYTGARQRYEHSMQDIYSPDLIQVRKSYEAGIITKEEAIKLVNKINYKIKISERLIWSVLYKMFARK